MGGVCFALLCKQVQKFFFFRFLIFFWWWWAYEMTACCCYCVREKEQVLGSFIGDHRSLGEEKMFLYEYSDEWYFYRTTTVEATE